MPLGEYNLVVETTQVIKEGQFLWLDSGFALVHGKDRARQAEARRIREGRGRIPPPKKKKKGEAGDP